MKSNAPVSLSPANSISNSEASATAFVTKLYAMLQDFRSCPYIFWSASGKSIVIPDPERFSNSVLPMYVIFFQIFQIIEFHVFSTFRCLECIIIVPCSV